MRTNRPEHLKTFGYLGLHRYFLTFCTFQRRQVFVHEPRVAVVSTQIERAAAAEGFAQTAYCYMPDHVHLLVEGQSDCADCRAFVARAKQLSGFHYAKVFHERLWQRYGYERVLRSHEATLSVVRYIVENPVRAGLAQHPADYPFTGSSAYTLEQIIEAVQMSRTWRSG